MDHDTAHSTDVTRRSRRLGVEFAQTTHSLPFVSRNCVVAQANELGFALPAITSCDSMSSPTFHPAKALRLTGCWRASFLAVLSGVCTNRRAPCSPVRATPEFFRLPQHLKIAVLLYSKAGLLGQSNNIFYYLPFSSSRFFCCSRQIFIFSGSLCRVSTDLIEA